MPGCLPRAPHSVVEYHARAYTRWAAWLSTRLRTYAPIAMPGWPGEGVRAGLNPQGLAPAAAAPPPPRRSWRRQLQLMLLHTACCLGATTTRAADPHQDQHAARSLPAAGTGIGLSARPLHEPAADGARTGSGACGSRRRDCHSAAPPCTFSRCFNSDGERASVK